MESLGNKKTLGEYLKYHNIDKINIGSWGNVWVAYVEMPNGNRVDVCGSVNILLPKENKEDFILNMTEEDIGTKFKYIGYLMHNK